MRISNRRVDLTLTEMMQAFVLGLVAGGALYAWRGWQGLALGVGGACLAVLFHHYRHRT